MSEYTFSGKNTERVKISKDLIFYRKLVLFVILKRSFIDFSIRFLKRKGKLSFKIEIFFIGIDLLS